MKCEIKIMKEPEELLAWIDEYDILMGIELEDAKILFGYLEGHGYGIGTTERGELVRQDICEEYGEIIDYNMDDLIDCVCEWNYSLILEAEEARNDPDHFLDFVEKQNRYDELKKEEKRLDRMFDKTIYGKEMEELATTLAAKIIKSQKDKKEVSTVSQVSEIKNSYITDKKGR